MPLTTNQTIRRIVSTILSVSILLALVGLIISAWPPAPAFAQAAETTFVKRVSLKVNDVVYSASTKMLYVSVPSDAGAMGNSIATVDPATGEVISSVFVGSEPNRLALADDGRTLYVALDGAFAVRRFDIVTQTPGQQFAVGVDPFNGPYAVSDLAVAPSDPDIVAVARGNSSVAVYENGIQRPTVSPGYIDGANSLAYSASASKLYGGSDYSSGGLSTMSIDAAGVTVMGRTSFPVGGRIKFDSGLVFTSSGQVINPDTGTLLGTFALGTSSQAFAPDSTAGRAYYVTHDNFSSELILKAFDINTFTPIGSAMLTGVRDDPFYFTNHLVRWGANGLAFRSRTRELFLIQTTLIPSSEAVPAPQPLPSPVPTPTPAYVATFLRKINLQANDIVYSQSTGNLYASVPSTSSVGGNTITAINPQTGAIGTGVFIGSEPDKLALSDDGQTLYTYLKGAHAIRRFDAQTQTPGLQFALDGEQRTPDDMDVVPGSPQSLATILTNTQREVAIFDNGTRRANASRGGDYGISSIEFGANSAILYGSSWNSDLVKFTVDAAGLQSVSPAHRLLNNAYAFGMKFAGGRLYQPIGRVVDPEASKVIGTFQQGGSALAVDSALNRAFFVNNSFVNAVTLTAFDTNTFRLIGSVTLPGVTGTPTSLVRWGVNGLALRTRPDFGGQNTDGQVYIVQTALVSDQEPISTGVNFGNVPAQISESPFDSTFTVLRTGDASGTTTVDYVIGGGTATAGSDYAAASGTLTFAPGELSKTFSVSIIDDNIYEPQETFNVTLSNASGNAVLVNPSTVTVAIYNSDQPYISLTTASFAEPDSGTVDAAFTVQLSNPSTETITVDYSTADGTAIAGSDYTAVSGTLTFPPLSTTATINVKIIGDTLCEDNETFNLTVSNPTGGARIGWGGPVPVTIADGSAEPPVLMTEETTGRALAFDAVTWVREPISVISTHNFSPDQRTRLALLATNLEERDCTLIGAVTVQMDSWRGSYTLPIESLADVPNLSWLKQVTVKLPDELIGVDYVLVSIKVRGVVSNQVFVQIKP